MEPKVTFDLSQIVNLQDIANLELNRVKGLRNLVKDLEFIPVDSIGTYSSVSYKSIDGGRMGVYFDPFEFDLVLIADSIGNELMNYLVPKAENLSPEDFLYLDKFSEVTHFLSLLGINSITQVSNILASANVAMELTEYACIFERLTRDKNEPLIVMMDGLLRTIAIKPQHIQKLISIIKNFPRARLVGVAKSSRLINLISSSLFIENKIPPGHTGFIEIPWEIEKVAYKWKGRGIQDDKKSTHLFHAFGKLYVVKLSKTSNLLVTIEIPYDFENDCHIYTKKQIYEIIGHLIKDSAGSYPILGYPQTIMRAHEKAVRFGFTASIWRDKIIQYLLDNIGDQNIKRLIVESNYLRDYVDKGILGGF